MTEATMEDSGAAAGDLTKEEDELYDRQIRVWGVDTQCALRDARILVVVAVGTGEEQAQQVLAAEIVKNLALAGIGSLHIHFQVASSCSNAAKINHNLSFLGQSIEEVQSTLLDMNDRMNLKVTQGKEKHAYIGDQGERESESGPSRYTVALVVGKQLLTLDQISVELVKGRTKPEVLFAVGVKGGCGFAFCERAASASNETAGRSEGVNCTTIGKSFQVPEGDLPRRTNKLYAVLRAIYLFESKHQCSPCLKDLDIVLQLVEAEIKVERNRPSKELVENFLETAEEMPAVSAVVGGSLAQEVIKAISGKGQLMNNFYLFSAYGSQDSGEAKVECILPKSIQTNS